MFFRFTFSLMYGSFYLLSLLPFPVMYLISDFLYLILYYVVGYRKKMSWQQLRNSFPEKSDAEITALQKAYYHHLCDTVVEFFKEFSISQAELRKRMHITNPEVLAQIDASPEGWLCLATHYGNFEWMTAMMDMSTQKKCYGVYSPLTNRYFEELAQRIRKRWGGDLLPMKQALSNSLEKLDEGAIVGFICDQSPSRRKVLYFTEFLGQTTAVHDSFAYLALKKSAKVYFADVQKVKRGHYTMTMRILPMEDFLPYSQENVYRFTDFHAGLLEERIRQAPAYWLWSHRRWKHQPQEGDVVRVTQNS